MKRLFYLMLVVLGTMAFVSCSDDDENNGKIDEPIDYSEIIINTTPYIDEEYDDSENALSLIVTTISYGDTINIDYGNGYSQTVTSTELEEDPWGISATNKYGYVFEYTFPDEEDHTITIRGNINGIDCSNDDYCGIITSLDVSKCTGLTYLDCDANQLTSLDVSKNTALTYLNCYDNDLTSLNVSGCTALIDLGCRSNYLTSLDVSGCTALESLTCYSNELTSLDVSGCTALTQLSCSENHLTTLDVSKNTALEYLYCYNNQLTTLDVSGCTALTRLYCMENQLTTLDVSKNTALTELRCSENQFTAAEMNKIYEALPTVKHGYGSLSCDQLGNPSIAEQKGWDV